MLRAYYSTPLYSLEQQKELDALIAEITLEDEEEGTAASNKNELQFNFNCQFIFELLKRK